MNSIGQPFAHGGNKTSPRVSPLCFVPTKHHSTFASFTKLVVGHYNYIHTERCMNYTINILYVHSCYITVYTLTEGHSNTQREIYVYID